MRYAIEETKEKKILTKDEIIKHVLQTVKEKPKPLIEHLIKKIVLYNDKIEIHYNYTDNRTPEDESHREFCFNSFNRTFEIDKHQSNDITVLRFTIKLFI